MKEKLIYKANLSKAQTEKNISEIAKNIGLTLPSTHTAIFIARFFDIEKANGNGVRLSKAGVEEALPGLKFSQINFEHLREDMVGVVVDAWIEGEAVFGAFTFAKNLYPVEYERAIEKFDRGDLSVSFELLSSKSTQENLEDGTRRLNDIDFQGMGLLLDNPPAYPNAKVLEHAKIDYLAQIKSDFEPVFAKKLEEKFSNVPMDQPVEQVYLVTSVDNEHWHVALVNLEGNGTTLASYGDHEHNHIHDIVNWQFQVSDQHAHRIRDEVIAKIKEVTRKHLKKNKKDKQKDVEGEKIMTEEQKAQVDKLREELGDYAKDVSDEALLDEAKVQEIRDAKAEAEKAEVEKSEIEKAQEEIEALKAEVEQLKETLKAKDSEVERVRQEAEKVATMKIELKDNKYIAEFKDEDYLDETKVAEAKRLKEIDDREATVKAKEEELKAKEEELKKKSEEKASETTTEEAKAGDEEPEVNDAYSILSKNRKK